MIYDWTLWANVMGFNSVFYVKLALTLSNVTDRVFKIKFKVTIYEALFYVISFRNITLKSL